jgi:hypothetical protein
MNVISCMAHDEAICKRIESQLNSLIDSVKSAGGSVWLQSKENKEHFYKLTDYVSVCFFTPCVREDME